MQQTRQQKMAVIQVNVPCSTCASKQHVEPSCLLWCWTCSWRAVPPSLCVTVLQQAGSWRWCTLFQATMLQHAASLFQVHRRGLCQCLRMYLPQDHSSTFACSITRHDCACCFVSPQECQLNVLRSDNDHALQLAVPACCCMVYWLRVKLGGIAGSAVQLSRLMTIAMQCMSLKRITQWSMTLHDDDHDHAMYRGCA